MATDSERFAEIADAIRSKTGGTAAIKATAFAEAIRGISTGFPRRVTERTVYPHMSDLNGAYRAVACAMGYWNAKAGGSKAWAYRDGHGCIKGAGEVNDSDGAGVIDCSTYIDLVLRGIGYAQSPYAATAEPGASTDPQAVTCRDEAWAEPYLDRQTDPEASNLRQKGADGLYRCLTAADLAAYYEAYGLAWEPGGREPRAGDLCFFDKRNADGALAYPTRWRGISHVGIMTGPEAFLNATDYPSSGNLIRTKVSSRAPMLYARPLYGGLSAGASDDLDPARGANLLPGLWAGFPLGESAVNGLAVSCGGLGLSFSGAPSASFTRKLVSPSCPLHLPPGNYRLSGFSNGTGTNTASATHSLWGLRVWDADGSGIPGTTWSSSGAATAARTPCWDMGGGCEFELASETQVSIDLYLGARDCSQLGVRPVLARTA